ncbi:NAD(P)-dependent oxidoreductase [Alphaproteobacteria bacterium]|nr:NAD(P)-dependent oxidoreductase [Alphaproteobacteria bacterium]MDC3270388.1 NAD(P)-dependent oxidoreductase [Alphaproteobacteria bacterium]
MNVLVTGGLGFIGSKVVLQLLKRNISVIIADLDIKKNKSKLEQNIEKIGKDKNLIKYEKLDITNHQNVEKIFQNYNLDSVINLAYGIGAICEEKPLLASRINIVGTTTIFEMIVKYKIRRLVFASSETVYGANQEFFGKKAVTEDDFSGIDNHYFTYGVMKLLNEFMAEKYIKRHGCSIAYTRPSVVFGYGRQNTALNWAEDFAAKPALNKTANLPFSKSNKDNWIYVDDCAEQLVRLALKDKLNYSCFNTGSETVDGHQLEKTVKKFIPKADLVFDENIKSTPLIDDQNDERIRKEIDFNPRSFEDGVKCLIQDVKESNKKI